VNVLLTGAASPLGRAVAPVLKKQRHRIRLTDRKRLRSDLPFTQSQLGHGPSTDKLVDGIKAIVHIPGPADPSADAATWIDACTRCTYNLLIAGVEAGVEHMVYVSTLDLFTDYDEDFLVTPSWRPRPSTEPAVMAPHLGEFVAREFAQTQQIRLTVLRLGHLVDADDVSTDDDLDPLALDPRDAAAGIAACLTEGAAGHDRMYRIHHLQGDFDGARFPTADGRRRLDVALKHDFGRPRKAAS
jgi:uronate dehydrogenase